MTTQTYADLPALRDWLGNYSPDVVDPNRDDYALSTALIAASRAIDNATHRRFWLDEEPTTYTVQARSGQVVFVPDLSSDDIDVTVIRDGETIPVEVSNILPAEPPYRRFTVESLTLYPGDTVTVTGRFGFPAIPVPIEQATLMLAARLFKRKLSPEGITGFAGELGAMRVTSRDFDVEALIAPYQLIGFA